LRMARAKALRRGHSFKSAEVHSQRHDHASTAEHERLRPLVLRLGGVVDQRCIAGDPILKELFDDRLAPAMSSIHEGVERSMRAQNIRYRGTPAFSPCDPVVK